MGWIMCGVSLHDETAMLSRYAPDLARDKFHVWLSKYHWVPDGRRRSCSCSPSAAGPASCGESSCASPSVCIPPGWSTRQPTCGDRAASKPATIRATAGGLRCSQAVKDGTTITMRILSQRATASPGTNSTRTISASCFLKKLGLAWDVKVAQYDPKNPKPAGVA